MTVDPTEVVQCIANDVRKLYDFHMRQALRIASVNVTEPRWANVWTRIAVFCIENRISPAEFIEVQFHSCKPYPEIWQLASHVSFGRFVKERVNCAALKASSVVIQSLCFEKLVKHGYDPEKHLDDYDQGFDPLFVYITASIRGLEALKAKYLEPAVIQYMTSTHYDKIYGTCIPEDFKQQVNELRGSICQLT